MWRMTATPSSDSTSLSAPRMTSTGTFANFSNSGTSDGAGTGWGRVKTLEIAGSYAKATLPSGSCCATRRAKIRQNASSASGNARLCDAFTKAVISSQDATGPDPALDPDEFAKRLREIDWHRYRKHWVDITGYKIDPSTGGKKMRDINDGHGGKLRIVDAKAENTAAVINSVAKKILSPTWTDLKSDVNAK